VNKRASWVALAWISITASRPLSSWFQVGGAGMTPDAYLDGSPVDALVFLVLIVAAAFVLARRGVALGAVASQNPALTAYVLYCALSVVWSEYPFVAFKRWFKDFGNYLVILVLLTEANPTAAVRAVFTRCACILVPLSYVFVKYFPELGRAYTGWNRNDLMYVGVAAHKNTLGALLLVAAVFVTWDLFLTRAERSDARSRPEHRVRVANNVAVLAATWWLLTIANSATALACAVFGLALFVLVGLPVVRRRVRRTELYLAVGACAWFTLDWAFGLAELLVWSLGRDMTLTTRTRAWDIVLANQVNPLLGAGFKSFWAGDRMARLWVDLPGIVQAHNGYVETYLNGGILGVLMLAAAMLAGLRKAKLALVSGDPMGRMRLVFWILALLYNFSEASFNQLSLMWVVTLLVIVEAPQHAATMAKPLRSERPISTPETRGRTPVTGPATAASRLHSRDQGLAIRSPGKG
jgi:O-antigen ligase